MAKNTGEVTGNTNSGADWESLAEPPAMEAEPEPVKDAEYYRNNFSQINELTFKYSSLLGADARKRSKRDAATGELIDENGLPLYPHHLNRYLRKNPDEIDRVFALCELMSSGSQDVSEAMEEALNEEIVEAPEEEPGAVAEEELKVAEEEPMSTENGAEWKSGLFYINGYENMTTDQRLDALESGLDGINTLQAQTSHSNMLERIIGDTDDETKAAVELMRAQDMVAHDKEWLKIYEQELASISPIRPWSSKDKKDRADTLKTVITDTRNSLKASERLLAKTQERYDTLADVRKSLHPGEPDGVQHFVDRLRALNGKRQVINEALHIRDLTKDIRMRESWIKYDDEYVKRDQEKYGGKEKDSYESRAKEKADWRKEIESYKQQIADFQRRYPNFNLTPPSDKGERDYLFAKPAAMAESVPEEEKLAA